MIAVLLTLCLIWFQSFRRRKPFISTFESKMPRNLSIGSSGFYQTIASGIYLESINTSATTLSFNPDSPPLYHEILP